MFKTTSTEDILPRRSTFHSAGYDFIAPRDIEIKAGEWTVFDTEIYMSDSTILPSQVLLLMPRSSLGFKYGFRLRNTIGVIDADYRDTIKASVTCDVDYTIRKGDKYMQGIVVNYYTISGEILPETQRNGGVGSTGR